MVDAVCRSVLLRTQRRSRAKSSTLTFCDKMMVKRRGLSMTRRLTDIDGRTIKVGDRVLFGKYSGQTVKVEGEELLVMREEDIMGVIE